MGDTKKKKSKSVEAIMNSGKTLFWQHGISRVTVDEICKHAEVSKMTFYRHLENKTELALKVVQEEIDENLKKYQEIMLEEISYHTKLENVMAFQQESSKSIGINLIHDIYQNNSAPKVLALLQKTSLEMQEIIRCDFLQAQEDGHIRSDVKIEMVMHILSVLAKEMESAQLLGIYGNVEAMKTDVTKFIFNGILTKR